jgi:WD40 repeat protein
MIDRCSAYFAEFHQDTIRELDLCPFQRNMVASCGFDGNVFITDITKLSTNSENSVYFCRDVVGSVRWHPSDPCVVSATTDTGVFHMIDIRTGSQSLPRIFDTAKTELYTHLYCDSNTVLLGYGDATFKILDLRYHKRLVD